MKLYIDLIAYVWKKNLSIDNNFLDFDFAIQSGLLYIMINFSDFDKKFQINSIYKNDYIKVHTIFNQEFEYFSKTIFSLNKKPDTI